MGNFNDVGRLTKDPELRFIQGSGKAVCTFNVAVDREFKNKEGNVEADFHSVEVWGKQAEHVANHLGKGRLVQVKGNLQNNNYEDKETGKKVYGYKIVAERVKFLDFPKKNED